MGFVHRTEDVGFRDWEWDAHDHSLERGHIELLYHEESAHSLLSRRNWGSRLRVHD